VAGGWADPQREYGIRSCLFVSYPQALRERLLLDEKCLLILFYLIFLSAIFSIGNGDNNREFITTYRSRYSE
jgi:hypothetical protein